MWPILLASGIGLAIPSPPVMKHLKLRLALPAALLGGVLVLLLAGQMAGAERINYGQLWRNLSGAEKELLLIGYARGLRSAEASVDAAVRAEPCEPEVRQRLLVLADSLPAGLTSPKEIKEILKWLDTFYADERNQYIDWPTLVRLARTRCEGASEEQIDAELSRLRQ